MSAYLIPAPDSLAYPVEVDVFFQKDGIPLIDITFGVSQCTGNSFRTFSCALLVIYNIQAYNNLIYDFLLIFITIA